MGGYSLYRVFAQAKYRVAAPPRTGLIVDAFGGTGMVTQLLRKLVSERIVLIVKCGMLDKAKGLSVRIALTFYHRDILEIHLKVANVTSCYCKPRRAPSTQENGGLPALLESVYDCLSTGGAFVFNLDTTSIMIDGVQQLYDKTL